MPTRVLLLRHAETATPHLFHGAESDVGLSERGRRQADAVAERQDDDRELGMHHQVAVEGAEGVGGGGVGTAGGVLAARLGIGDQAAPEQVVEDEGAADLDLGQQEVEVAAVLGLGGVDPGEVEAPVESGDRLERRPLDQPHAPGDAAALEVAAGARQHLRITVDRHHLGFGRAARETEGAVADRGADLDDPPRPGGAREDGQEPPDLGVGDRDVRGRGCGLHFGQERVAGRQQPVEVGRLGGLEQGVGAVLHRRRQATASSARRRSSLASNARRSATDAKRNTLVYSRLPPIGRSTSAPR